MRLLALSLSSKELMRAFFSTSVLRYLVSICICLDTFSIHGVYISTEEVVDGIEKQLAKASFISKSEHM